MESQHTFRLVQPTGVSRKVHHRMLLGDGSIDMYCVRFDPQDRYLAAGCGDGTIRIFNIMSGKLAYCLNQGQMRPGDDHKMPTTSVRWRPVTSAARTKNVLISVHSDGSVQHWHTTSGKSIHKMYDISNPLTCLDVSADGRSFATAGSDLIVRVYDEATKSCVVEFQGSATTQGHANRIFAIKFNPEDPNILVSGGWDNTVKVWDMREGVAIKSIYGPHLCGDSLDIRGREILCGSWRETEQLQTYYLSTGELIGTIDWDGGMGLPRSTEPCQVYSVQYSKHDHGEMIVAGGSKNNEVRFFDGMNLYKPFACITDLAKPVFSIDFSNNGSLCAVTGTSGYIQILSVQKI